MGRLYTVISLKKELPTLSNDAERPVVSWLPGNKPRDAALDIVLLLLLTFVLVISATLQGAQPETNWFMRSGAIMVLVGAVLEYRHNGFLRKADTESIKWASGVGGPVIFEQPTFRKVLGYLAHVCVVVGTFVAAYGDLIYAKYTST